jgi:hypothetical protein
VQHAHRRFSSPKALAKLKIPFRKRIHYSEDMAALDFDVIVVGAGE